MCCRLLKNFPNTYAFTKSIAEDVVAKFSKGVPVAVFRPGIGIILYFYKYVKSNLLINTFYVVVSAAKEPICGWIDNLYGPTGVLVGVGGGLIRAMHMDREVTANVVPIDMCVNAILASAWDIGTNRYLIFIILIYFYILYRIIYYHTK